MFKISVLQIIFSGYSIKMPRVAKTARKSAAPRRKAGKRSYPTNVNTSLQPVPQRYICKMKYSETVASDMFGNFHFNLNSIFDPNRSGVGHQPYGHDTLATLYNRYRVINCSYRIQAMLASNVTPVQVGAIPANEVLSFSTISELRENPRSRYITQNPGADVKTLSGNVYIPSLMGRTKVQYMTDDRYQAQIGVSPSELAILNIFSASPGDAAVAQTIQVLLEFTVEFFDIKHLAQS